jgi:uncharacterized protein
MTPEQIIKRLALKPHPEGGYFRESYRSEEGIPEEALPEGYEGPRHFSTAIYYLLTADTSSRMHRLASDEVFHFYLGDPVEWTLLFPDGEIKRVVMGSLLEQGHTLQMVVPAGTWFGGRLAEGGVFGLMGTTVAPGFDTGDFVLGTREELLKKWPKAEKDIVRLT